MAPSVYIVSSPAPAASPVARVIAARVPLPVAEPPRVKLELSMAMVADELLFDVVGQGGDYGAG